MDLLTELKDKKIFMDGLNKVIAHGVPEVIFTGKPPSKQLLQYTHPLFRLMLMMDGEHTYQIFSRNTIEHITLNPDKALFCQRRGMTGLGQKEVSGSMLTIVFFPQYVRFLITARQSSDTPWEHFWYHTAKPLRQAGIYTLQALDELANSGHTANKDRLMVTTLLYLCLDLLKEDSQEQVGKSFRTYQNIKAYMLENMHKNINRHSVAKALKINPSHISKLFNAHDEHNFNFALKILRMEHAGELLKEDNFSIDEIAEQCGFVNTGYFIRAFKAFYGRTPGAFRRGSPYPPSPK
jgi:AraC-like DNA-binding protein